MIDSIIISKALQQISKLTLPSFGTLLKKDGGEIVFTSFLKNDDKVFTSIIMNSYGVDQVEASQMVSEFISNILAKISENGSFPLPEIGFLVLDPVSNAIKLKNEEPQQAPVIQQQRQPITPKPIIGVPQSNPQQVWNSQQQIPLRGRPQGIPQRPQSIPQRPMQRPQGIPQRPQQRPQPQPRTMGQRPYPHQSNNGQPSRMNRPVDRKHRPNTQDRTRKTDWLLVVAILVIIIMIAIVIYSMYSETIYSI